MKILFLLCIFFIATVSNAKNDNSKIAPIKETTAQVSLGSVMGTILNGIKSSAFESGSSGKSDLISQLSGAGASDYLQYGAIAGQLAGALKGSSFLPDWANKKDGILDQLTKAGSIAEVAGGVSGIVGLLNPGSLTKGFKKQKSSVTSALNILSMIK
ncbi:MAG: hypothetical protein ABI462_14745 [Ignavibacteria bacterium]